MEDQTIDESLALGMGVIQNNSDPSNYMIASNGRGVGVGATNTVKGKQQQEQRGRRSIIGKQMSADNLNDAQATTSAPSQINCTVSLISQRPRRQVKHKFIKSANINLVDKSNEQNNVLNTDVNEQEQQQLMQILSPNCKVRLVPVIHRLPVNAAKLNWHDVISQTPSEQIEINETMTTTTTASTTLAMPLKNYDNSEDGDDNGNVKSSSSNSGSCVVDENGVITTTNIECEPITSVDKEMKTERHKKLSNSKQAIRRGRQLRQTVCPVEPAECDNGTEMPTCTEQQTEQSVQENNVEYSVLTSGKRNLC